MQNLNAEMTVILDKKRVNLTDKLRAATRMTPKALIATNYADMLVPHGGTVWLGSIIKIAKLFNVVEYMSRTSALSRFCIRRRRGRKNQ